MTVSRANAAKAHGERAEKPHIPRKTDESKKSRDILAIANMSKQDVEAAAKKNPTEFVRGGDHLDKESRLGNGHEKRGSDHAISDRLLDGKEAKDLQYARGTLSADYVKNKDQKLEEVAKARAQALRAAADGSIAGRDSKTAPAKKERDELDKTFRNLSGVQLATTAEQLHQDVRELSDRYNQLRDIAKERTADGKKFSADEQREALLTYEQLRGTSSAEKAALLVIQEQADKAKEDVHDWTLRGLNDSLDANRSARNDTSTGIHGAENDGKEDDIAARRNQIKDSFAALDHGYVYEDGHFEHGVATLLAASDPKNVANLEGGTIDLGDGRQITIDNQDLIKRASDLTNKTFDITHTSNPAGLAIVDYLKHQADGGDAAANFVNLDADRQKSVYDFWKSTLPEDNAAAADKKIDADQDGYPDDPIENPEFYNIIQFGQTYQNAGNERREEYIRFFEAVAKDPEGVKRYFENIEAQNAAEVVEQANAQNPTLEAASVPEQAPVEEAPAGDGSVPLSGDDVAIDPNAGDSSGPAEDGSSE